MESEPPPQETGRDDVRTRTAKKQVIADALVTLNVNLSVAELSVAMVGDRRACIITRVRTRRRAQRQLEEDFHL